MSSKIKNILNLLRVRQYYKNGLIFVGAFFSGKLIDPSLWYLLIIGFVLLCCASSFNYVINDIRDIEKDKKHVEKLEKRPLASGDLSVLFAVVLLAILLAIISGLITVFIFPNWNFIIMVLLIIITGQLYNHLFKKIAFIDVLSLSLIYLWRALAGCFLIEVFISPWLFLAIFEIALFLVIAKRKGDLLLIGEEKAANYKKSYDKYSQKLLDQFHVIIAGALFITYSLYLIIHFNLFSAENVNLHEYITILTIPLSLYIIMRYMYLTSARPEIARSTEKALLDPGIVIAGILLLGILTYSFYIGAFIRLLNL
ncbi:MAG: UbiA prenyltransferase family protein [Candidatus Hodarchaeota archaeon]